jgi:hypothetical protein
MLPPQPPLSRRSLLQQCGLGLGALAWGALEATLPSSARSAPVPSDPFTLRPSHFPRRAKHVIHLFMNGGPSHLDTFDPKPLLARYAGQKLPMANLATERPTGAALPSPFRFRRYGQSGIEVSELFPHVAQSIDDIAVIRSMHADVPNHEPSLLLLNCGEARLVRPSMGSWICYGLGTENANLPAFVSMCPGGYPIQETQNWQSGFLPSAYQGTYLDTQHAAVEQLIANVRHPHLDGDAQRAQLDLVQRMNRRHLAQRQDDPALDARIRTLELGFRLLAAATDAFDVDREPESIRRLYGEGTQARQMIMARRLVERGVRFVQVWHGAGQPWDAHDDLADNHRRLARECDQAIGALLVDLKQRGLLDETLVIWGGEFGRTPTVELPKEGANQGKVNGRDHNHYGYTMWLAGGGVRGGYVHGATDEFGFRAVEQPVHVHDLQATILHLLGLDHELLTYRHAGRDFRLTDVYGNVVQELIA